MVQPGDKIAVDSYTYPNFIELANMLNIQLIPIGGDVLGMMPDQLDFVCRKTNLQGKKRLRKNVISSTRTILKLIIQ